MEFGAFGHALNIERRLFQLDLQFLWRHDLDGKKDKLLRLRPHALRSVDLCVSVRNKTTAKKTQSSSHGQKPLSVFLGSDISANQQGWISS